MLLEPEIGKFKTSRVKSLKESVTIIVIVTQVDASRVSVKMREMLSSRKNSSCQVRQNEFHFK